jgi:NO-binding membrane sensor protein with MHYT domain
MVVAAPPLEQFAYGPVNPVLAFVFSFLGALFGLMCTARARRAPRSRRARWLAIAAVAIGGQGIWLMHFMAMLGFDVPAATIRYNAPLTVASLIIAIAVVAIGLFIAGYTRPSPFKVVAGGMLTGIGVAAMHYTGMAAMNIDYHLSYNLRTVGLSAAIAVVAATAALWFTVSLSGTRAIFVAALIMAVAVCGMHYTGMVALNVHGDHIPGLVPGISPLAFLAPIVIVTTASLVGLGFVSLNMATDEDFRLTVDWQVLDINRRDAGYPTARGVHPVAHPNPPGR